MLKLNKLFQNEWIKLFGRKGTKVLIALALIASVLAVGIQMLSDRETRVSWQEPYQNAVSRYEAQLNQYPEYNAEEWGSETEYKADILRWNNEIQKNRFCLDSGIPSWDWRMGIVDRYFRNMLLLDAVRAGWNSQDLERYFGFPSDLDLAQVEETNKELMVYILGNDYSTYNKEQLQLAEERLLKLKESVFVEEGEKTVELAQADTEMLERYVTYNVPPNAKDNWISVAIARIRENQGNIIEWKYEVNTDAETARENAMLSEAAKVSIQKDLFSLTNNLPSSDIMKEVYTERTTYLQFFENSFLMSASVVILGILLAVWLICMEYRYGTIATLVLYPFKRNQMLHAKYLVLEVTLLCVTLLECLITLCIGKYLYPVSGTDPVYMTVVKGTVYWVPYFAAVLLRYLAVFVQAVIMVTFAVMVSVLVRSSSVAVFSGLFAYLILPQIVRMMYSYFGKFFVLRYEMFVNLDLTRIAGNLPPVTFAEWWAAALIVIVWWFIFRRVSYAVYKRQEI